MVKNSEYNSPTDTLVHLTTLKIRLIDFHAIKMIFSQNLQFWNCASKHFGVESNNRQFSHIQGWINLKKFHI